MSMIIVDVGNKCMYNKQCLLNANLARTKTLLTNITEVKFEQVLSTHKGLIDVSVSILGQFQSHQQFVSYRV